MNMCKILKDVADVYYGRRQNTVVDINGAYPILGTGGILGMARRPLFKGPGIVVGRKGTLNNPIYVNEDFWVVDTAYAVLPKDNVHPRWLFYTLRTARLEELNEATGVPSLNRDRLYQVCVPNISFEEQVRIANVLDKMNIVIQKGEAVIVKQKQIYAGMLRDLLSGEKPVPEDLLPGEINV